MKTAAASVLLAAAVGIGATGMSNPDTPEPSSGGDDHTLKKEETVTESVEPTDSIMADGVVQNEPEEAENDRYLTLTESDFKQVAEELGVEVAAIKAVVVIEAGHKMEGFWAPGIPVINFDPTMYSRYKNTARDRSGDKGATVPSGLKGYALKEWTQLTNARKTNKQGADMGTFWGMFQIGGFNYKLCGCESVEEMVERMSTSELEQLELFATFLVKTGMVSDLRNKNWAGFARKYNGASYARRGYHTKMANAYKRFSSGN